MADIATIPHVKRSDGAYDNLYFKSRELTVSLVASKWSSTVPYTQTVTVSGITAKQSPIVGLQLNSTIPATVKQLNKNFGFLDKAVTGSGNITFTCYNKKPTIDFVVVLHGI